VVVAGARKSMSKMVMPIPTLRMEEHRHEEVNEHGLLLLSLLYKLSFLHGEAMEGSRWVGGTLACVGRR
jgi:hypothetical protein